MKLREKAISIFNAAIKAVDPEVCVSLWFEQSAGMQGPAGGGFNLDGVHKLYLIGFGKASAAMARSAENILGDRIDDGLVVTKYGHGTPLSRCRLMEAGHPEPDENGVEAADAILDIVSKAGPQDVVLCMISGGGSALTPSPAGKTSLADKRDATRLLLSCGATIHQINTIRKHLSRIKGGRLVRAANGAQIFSLILSDVIGDDVEIIASGATAPDESTYADCLEILKRFDLKDRVPPAVFRHLSEGMLGCVEETPKPGEAIFSNVRNYIIGSISDALEAAARKAGRFGYKPLILTSMIRGEAREAAKVLCAAAEETRRFGRPVKPPACLLSGGETTVTVRGDGLGGRNMELSLSAAIELSEISKILILSAGTDGTDGPTDAAGAFADGTTVSRAAGLEISASEYLAKNDSYHFFKHLGDLFFTGPTRTNVMDIQIVIVEA